MVMSVSLQHIIDCGLEESAAAAVLPRINRCLASLPAVECWQHFSQHILEADHPFLFHQFLYQTTYADWDFSRGQPPAWFPSEEKIQTTHIAALMQELGLKSYAQLYAWSVRHRAEFWQCLIRRLGIRLRRSYDTIVDLSAGLETPQWLKGARLNIAESCFQADDKDPAIVFQAEGGVLARLSYGELETLTNRVANGLLEAGLGAGDAIAIALPMSAKSIAIYLGIVKAGCVVVSIADSFAPEEITTRLQLAGAIAIFTQDFIQRDGKHLPLYQKAVAAEAPQAIVLASRAALAVKLRPRDLSWEEFLSVNDAFEAIPGEPDIATNILFSSGTTGTPKAIPWTQTTPIKAAMDGHLHHNIHPGDAIAWPTNLGWMMGPWLIYAGLINRATLAIYEGSPTGRPFGQFVQDAGVTMLGVVPSLVSRWQMTDCMRGLDWSAIQAFSSTGECSNPQDMLFLMSLAGYRPIIEYCGGTEIGGGYMTGTLLQPCAPATFTTPALGLEVVILDEQGHSADKGEVFIVPPSIGLSTKLLNRDHQQVYFAHTPSWAGSSVPLRRHGDRMERLSDGCYRALGRVDDTMNLGGIKVSAAEIEQILNAEAGIRETAAIAISPPEGGPSQLVIYAVVLPGTMPNCQTLKASLQDAIRQHLNPLFKICDLKTVEALPRTASNKILRRVLREQSPIA